MARENFRDAYLMVTRKKKEEGKNKKRRRKRRRRRGDIFSMSLSRVCLQ